MPRRILFAAALAGIAALGLYWWLTAASLTLAVSEPALAVALGERSVDFAESEGGLLCLARTALVCNRDMEDLVEIGRQARPDLYALEPRKPAQIVPRGLRFGPQGRLYCVTQDKAVAFDFATGKCLGDVVKLPGLNGQAVIFFPQGVNRQQGETQ